MVVNKKELHKICNLEQSAFSRYGDVMPTAHGGFYIHIDNGSQVLGVAHLDTVQTARNFRISKGKVHSPRLDDRLGVYIMLSLLPSMGVKTDILLTTDEEMGMSTAEHFVSDKQYNWMYSFDRAGADVVMYQYFKDEYAELLYAYGFSDIGYGSYSDLCELGHLGAMGINIGTGYENYHSKSAYAKINIVKKNVGKFVDFYHDAKDIHFEHKQLFDTYKWGGYGQYKYVENYWDGVYWCTVCGLAKVNEPMEQKSIEYYNMCTECLDKTGDGMYCFSCLKDCGKEKYDKFSWVDTGLCEGCAYEEKMRENSLGMGWEDADYS